MSDKSVDTDDVVDLSAQGKREAMLTEPMIKPMVLCRSIELVTTAINRLSIENQA